MYKTIILSVVLCGCEAWWLILREERRLRVFKNRVLRRIFEPRSDKVVGWWRRLKGLGDRLCGLVIRVLGYRSGGPGSIPGTTRKKNVMGLERGPLSLVSTN
jgi:hypothetical protein